MSHPPAAPAGTTAPAGSTAASPSRPTGIDGPGSLAGGAPPRGYFHPGYAEALADIGEPRRLPRSGGSILLRPIPGTGERDGIGPYPLFCCADWEGLAADLDELRGDLVALSLVADPFGEHGGEQGLRRSFPDLVRPFKEHFVVDLSRRPESFVADHHRRNARRALAALEIEPCAEPVRHLDEWVSLYAVLAARHHIHGLADFSRRSFEAQLRLPGLEALVARRDGRIVGMTLWMRHRDVVYYHLGAYSPEGYDLKASFALFRTALDHFAGAGLSWLDLGSGPGLEEPGDAGGLARFKRGWSTGTRTAHLCGRILDPDRYRTLVAAAPVSDFFPAYRQPTSPRSARGSASAPSPRHELIPLAERDEWRDSLRGIPHAFAHTWESCAAFQKTSGLPTYLYRFTAGEARIVCPLVERPWEGTVDIATPYGFSGFIGTVPHPAFPAAWRDFARSRGWICGFLGLNPLLGGEVHADPAQPTELRPYNRLYVLDLASGEAALAARLSVNRRREIAAFDQGPGPVLDRRALADFFLAHHERFFTSRGAAAVYRFAPATFEALFALDSVLLVGAAGPAGLEAVSVFAHTPWAGEFLFNVSLPEGRRHSAALIWCGARRLMELGVPVLNLGGGIREGDGVARFKQRFGARELPLAALRQVYDRSTYEDLCRQAGADPEADGYFPPYRAPRASSRELAGAPPPSGVAGEALPASPPPGPAGALAVPAAHAAGSPRARPTGPIGEAT